MSAAMAAVPAKREQRYWQFLQLLEFSSSFPFVHHGFSEQRKQHETTGITNRIRDTIIVVDRIPSS